MENVRIRTTIEFLDMLQDHYKSLSPDGKTPVTDYRVAKCLGVLPQTVSKWRTGKHTFDDETCVEVAKILNLDPGYVIACIHLERTKSSELRDFWEGMALRSTNLAALALFGFLLVRVGLTL